MKTVALTGGIASGKTFVLNAADEEFPDVDTVQADTLAKEIYNQDNPHYEEVIDLLGPGILREDGEIDREKVADVVFEDSNLLRELEDLAHPYVGRKIEERISYHERRGTKLLLIEIPLLFQSPEVDSKIFDRVVLVSVDRENRIKRLMERDRINKSEAKYRVKLQDLPENARNKADHVIETDCSKEETKRKAVALIADILKLA